MLAHSESTCNLCTLLSTLTSPNTLLLPLRSTPISLTHLRGANSVNNNMTSLLSFSSISVNRNYCIVGASFGKMAAAAATRTVHHASPMPMPMSAKRYCSQYALRINNNINKNKNPAPHWNNFGRSPSCQQRRWNGGNNSSSSSSSKRDADANSHPPTPTSMAESSPNNSTSSSSSSTRTAFLQRFLAPKAMPPRNTPRWYAEMALICTVFGITGTSTMFLVRPAVSDVLGLKGSFKEGEC